MKNNFLWSSRYRPKTGKMPQWLMMCSVFLLFSVISVHVQSDDRPNIVLIYVDDQGWNELSLKNVHVGDKNVDAMRNDIFTTPNIDKLAAEGVLFTNAYSNAGMCAPSRASLLTGQYTPRHGIYTVNGTQPPSLHDAPIPNGLENIKRVLDEDTPTFVKELQKRDYKTAIFGKWHLGDITEASLVADAPLPISDKCSTNYNEPTQYSTERKVCGMSPTDGSLSTYLVEIDGPPGHFGFSKSTGGSATGGTVCSSPVPPGQEYSQPHQNWEYNGFYTLTTNPPFYLTNSPLAGNCLTIEGVVPNVPDDDSTYMTNYLTSSAIDFINDTIDDDTIDDASTSNQPFFIFLSFYAPHQPWVAENRDDNRTDSQLDRYKAMIRSIDSNVGKIVKRIMGEEDEGEEEKEPIPNTVVIFTSDNGIHEKIKTAINNEEMVEETENGKKYPLNAHKGSTLYEGGTRVPLIVWLSDLPEDSKRLVYTPVNGTDISQTILDLAGITNFEYLQKQNIDGESLIKIYSNDKREQPIYWYSPYVEKKIFNPGAAVRQGNWKLIEFFHVPKNDPDRFELYRVGNQPDDAFDNIISPVPEFDLNESNDLVCDGRYQDIKNELARKLLAWYEDDAVFPVRKYTYEADHNSSNYTHSSSCTKFQLDFLPRNPLVGPNEYHISKATELQIYYAGNPYTYNTNDFGVFKLEYDLGNANFDICIDGPRIAGQAFNTRILIEDGVIKIPLWDVDINDDNIVDAYDAKEFMVSYRKPKSLSSGVCDGININADFTNDHCVDDVDLNILGIKKIDLENMENYANSASTTPKPILEGKNCSEFSQPAVRSKSLTNNNSTMDAKIAIRESRERERDAGTATLRTTPMPVGLAAGISFDIAILVDADPTQTVDVVAAYLDFNPDMLRVNSLTAGQGVDAVWHGSVDHVQGQINFTGLRLDNENFNGQFTLANLNFTVLQPGGEQTLVFNTTGLRETDVFAGGVSIINTAQPGEVVFENIPMTPASCQLYAVHDDELNNSQFVVMSFLDEQGAYQVGGFRKLGPLYEGFDFESLAIHPQTDVIYAVLSEDVTVSEHLQGYLYTVDALTGRILPIGSTGFQEVEELAFAPDGTLWAWAKGEGLITIDLTTGAGQVKFSSDALVEGLTLSKDSSKSAVFYASSERALWKYDRDANTFDKVCSNLPGQTEALYMVSDELLLLGIHEGNATSVSGFNPQTCEVVEMDIAATQFNDIEAISLPTNACKSQ